MLVYIVRHAHAGVHGDPSYPDDSLRPLSRDGRRRFRKVARRLVRCGVQPDSIATSPLVRCRQTAEILAEAVGSSVELVELADLAPGGSLSEILSWTRRQRLSSVAWVGHAPDVSNYLAGLVGGTAGRLRFAKGAVAAVEFDGEPALGQGTLRWLVTAGILGC